MDYRIYKITNDVNGKVYIGQTTRTLEARLQSHFDSAKKPELQHIKFYRAINKYGAEHFRIEQIDSAYNQEDLDEKEKYWIQFHNSIDLGYNTALGGEGGNTYKGIETERLQAIRKKLSESKLGEKNPRAESIKLKSVKTGQELFFGSRAECMRYFNLTGAGGLGVRLQGKVKSLWRDEWLVAYSDNNYEDWQVHDRSTNHGTKVVLTKGTEIKEFPSKNKASNFLGIRKVQLLNDSYFQGWHITFSS